MVNNCDTFICVFTINIIKLSNHLLIYFYLVSLVLVAYLFHNTYLFRLLININYYFHHISHLAAPLDTIINIQ